MLCKTQTNPKVVKTRRDTEPSVEISSRIRELAKERHTDACGKHLMLGQTLVTSTLGLLVRQLEANHGVHA